MTWNAKIFCTSHLTGTFHKHSKVDVTVEVQKIKKSDDVGNILPPSLSLQFDSTVRD